MGKKTAAGRPPAKDPKNHKHVFCLTEQETARAREDIERIYTRIGVRMSMSEYAARAVAEFRGKLMP